ncbi:MAG: hypothetical protein ABI639_06775 [Thermoanaerobaculia bacterium]
MREEIAQADRKFHVRRALAAWRKAGLIDPGAEAAAAAGYADDRVRTSRVFRVLFCVFTWIGIWTAYGVGLAFLSIGGMSFESGISFAIIHIVLGGAVLTVAELLISTRRFRRFGIEEACAWIGSSFLVGGGIRCLSQIFVPGAPFLLVAGAWMCAALSALIIWRWATPGMGVVATSALFVGLSQLPANQLLIFVASAVLAWPLAELSVAAHISPEVRRRFGEAFVVAVLALYSAVHVEGLDRRLFRDIQLGSASGLFGLSSSLPEKSAWVPLAFVLTIVLPLGLLLVGVRRRLRAAIDLGLLLSAASFATIVARLHLEPYWLVLVVSGLALMTFALIGRRWLASRAGNEWRGLTALALVDDRDSLGTLEVVATLATFSPAARDLPARGFERGSGGDFGGGGASANF